MDPQPGSAIAQMAPTTGSLEVPEGLREALTGSRGVEGNTVVTDLPSGIVGSILARIPNLFDVASAFRASRVFWLARSAPFKLRLRPSRYQETSGFGDDMGSPDRTGKDATKLAARTRAALTGIRRVMPRTQELDLAGCPILDDDVTGVLADLQCLQCLVLDGCQKLTSSAADALASSVRTGPRVLSLQRCFRLGPAAAGNLLVAAAAEGSQLETVLLSHLDGLDLPQERLQSNPVRDDNSKEIHHMEIVKGIGNSDPGAGLRILALHNCGSLGNSLLVAISETCPRLEVLMLGGSVDGLGLSRQDFSPSVKAMEAVSALVGATERLSRLRILEITFLTIFVARAVRERVSKSIYVWDFCDTNSVATAAAVVASLKSPSQSNAGEDYVLGFPDDLSMGCNILSPSDQYHVESEAWAGQKRYRDLEGVNDGVCLLSKTSSSQYRRSHEGVDKRWDSNPEDILMALRAGANCSGARRRTPLHVAAALGESTVVANLLSIGAAARGMKDSAGGSALFLAAESGHAQVCDHLLRGGADVLASNRTGETPLYIAALKGHSAAVDVMLRHCQEYGINWQDADVYGDGWTPLMAATVADRQEVGILLLCAAGRTSKTSSQQFMYLQPKMGWEDGSLFDAKDELDNLSNFFANLSAQGHTSDRKVAAPQLLDAQNRYGQTALHIAARRGFLWFVTNLLRAGASPQVLDDYGLRAIDVARKQNHSLVEKLLKEWEEERKDGKSSSQAATSKKKPGSRRKGAKKELTASNISPGGNLKKLHSCAHRTVASMPNNSSVAQDSGENTPDASSYADSSNSTSGHQELSSLPDSPTSIVPSWMHSSPPVSPRFEHLPGPVIERRTDEGVDRRGISQNTPDLSGAEASHVRDMVGDTQNYWRGRGTRQRTSSGDTDTFIPPPED